MSDNPPLPPEAPFALADHRVIEFAGRDATAFAQAQFMNDVAALAPGHWQWNGSLTPKGRVIALFALLKLDEERLWLLAPDADAFAMAEQLRRFVFRRKVAIGVREDLLATGAFQPTRAASGARFSGDGGSTLELDMGGDGGPRTLRIAPADAPAAGPGASGAMRWAAADLIHGLPRLPASQAEHWTPQQLSLDRLGAYSVKKGCYPGQEIVARTHFLGQAKRGLVLFEAEAPVTPGHEVREDGALFGSVVACAADGKRHLALAVAPLERPPVDAHCDGIALRPRPLMDGLRR